MKCFQIQRLLSNYLDKSVSEQERIAIEEHLKTCADCQREFEMLHRLGETLDLVGDMQVSSDFGSQVLNEIGKTKVPVKLSVPFHRQLQKWAFTGAAIAIVLLTVLFGNYVGRTIYKEFTERTVEQEPIHTSIYKYGLCFEIPDSSFSVMYLHLRNGGAP